MASFCACFVVVTFFLWATDNLLNLALLLHICNNYEPTKIGICETLRIHQSFSYIQNFQEIKFLKKLLTWIEGFLSSLVYKTWTSIAHSIEKNTNKDSKVLWTPQYFSRFYPRLYNYENSRSQCRYKGCGGKSTKLCIWRNSRYWYENYPNLTNV